MNPLDKLIYELEKEAREAEAKKPKRKVVQIVVQEDYWNIYLCDDGTCWYKKYDKEWEQFVDLPPGCTVEEKNI